MFCVLATASVTVASIGFLAISPPAPVYVLEVVTTRVVVIPTTVGMLQHTARTRQQNMSIRGHCSTCWGNPEMGPSKPIEMVTEPRTPAFKTVVKARRVV